MVTAVKTDPTQKHKGMSLFVIERGMEGFERGRNLDKIGLHSQDTAELFFNDVRVPVANRLGEEGQGFRYLVSNLAQERLSIAVTGVASARQALAWTLDYVKERKAFGQPIGSFQNSKFVLAEVPHRGRGEPGLRRRLHHRPERGDADGRRGGDGQVVVHRAAEARRRPLPAALRWLRLHARVPDRPGLRRRHGSPRSTAARPRS